MRVAWDVDDPDERKAVWALASGALKAAGRGRELEELRDGVNAWLEDKAFNFLTLWAASFRPSGRVRGGPTAGAAAGADGRGPGLPRSPQISWTWTSATC